MTDDNPLAGWHVSKTVNLGHLITTMVMIVSAMWYLAGQENRISQAELNIQHLQQSRAQDEARSERKFDEIRESILRMDSKLDRLLRDRSNDR